MDYVVRERANTCIIDHAAKLHELPDEYLADVMPIAKKIATAQGLENYNILQVRFHMQLSSISPHSLLLNLHN
jgi:hypothetical protein